MIIVAAVLVVAVMKLISGAGFDTLLKTQIDLLKTQMSGA
jgi:hypothetical protein